MAASIRVSSMFHVSARMSTNTGTPPRSAQALAVETKAKEGMITSSPGWRSSNKVHISRACVHEVVRNTFGEVVMVSIVLLARCV